MSLLGGFPYSKVLADVIGEGRFSTGTTWVKMQSRLFEDITYTIRINGEVTAKLDPPTPGRNYWTFGLVPEYGEPPTRVIPLALWLDELRWAGIACGEGPEFVRASSKFKRRKMQ